LLAQGLEPAQVAAQLGIDAASVVGIAPNQPPPSTNAADRPKLSASSISNMSFARFKASARIGPAGGVRWYRNNASRRRARFSSGLRRQNPAPAGLPPRGATPPATSRVGNARHRRDGFGFWPVVPS